MNKTISKIVIYYSDGTFQEVGNNPYLPTAPYPNYPAPPAYPQPSTRCSKCNINLEGVMGYVCNNHPCPSGLGGTYCGTSELK